jgi:membrane protein YdbS with pleckstrin-like domain
MVRGARETSHMTIRCQYCGGETSEQAADCPQCGRPWQLLAVTTDSITAVNRTAPSASVADTPLWDGVYSARAAVGLWLFDVAAVIVVTFVAVPMLKWNGGLFLSLLTAVLGLGGTALCVMYRKLTAHYTLTAQHLTCQSGFFVTVSEQIAVIDVDDVACSQSRMGRWAGVGTVKVMPTDANRPDIFLNGILAADRVAALIEDACRAERQRRGLFIEST